MLWKDQIIADRIPQHIAIIMDGNGRWAKQQGKPRLFGHLSGVSAVRKITEAAARLGVGYLTLYAFSTENWNRPQEEVSGLMKLLVKTIETETATLKKNNVRLQIIGDLQRLPQAAAKSLTQCVENTSSNTGLTLVLALSYSSQWDITEATRKIATMVASGQLIASDINEQTIRNALSTSQMPYPELLIRTSGEYRISNFLLWELAYAELYFTPELWPDFNSESLCKAIVDYQGRERRFGKTSEQL